MIREVRTFRITCDYCGRSEVYEQGDGLKDGLGDGWTEVATDTTPRVRYDRCTVCTDNGFTGKPE